MKPLVPALVLGLLAGCSSTVKLSSGTVVPVQGSGITTGPTGLHMYAQGGGAVALILAGILLNYAEWTTTSRPPELLPGRSISVQDCTQPIDPYAGNLRCK